jgi:hypothetical protein
MSKIFDTNIIVPMDSRTKTALKLIARANERSMTAQARFFILEGMRLASEQDRLNEIEGNAVATS